MKPTLEEIKDNYERVLLRLHSGELAGIVKDVQPQLQVLRKTHWIDKAFTTADLDKSYNRKNSVINFNIDAIAFLSNKSLVNNAIVYRCDEDIDWDWDINDTNTSGGEIVTCSMGMIDDSSFEKVSVTISDDQMDSYEYAIQTLGLNNNPHNKDYIIKGENKTMNNILDIYADRKREKINKHYERLMELTKLADERYAIFKDCSDKLDKLYKEDGMITNHLVEPKLSETTKKRLEKWAELREEEYCKLENLMREVHAQLSMCETYEQKQDILRTYKIIKENGKVNG